MTHLPAVVEVADFAVVEVVAYVPVVAYVLVVSRAVAAIAWPEDLGSHPIARPPIAGRPGAPDRWCAGPSDSRVSWYGWRGAAYGAAAVGAAAPAGPRLSLLRFPRRVPVQRAGRSAVLCPRLCS